MSYSGISVLFACRLCAHSFDEVTDFIAHKQENHVEEFQRTACIVFEDKPLPNSSDDDDYAECSLPLLPAFVKLETFDDASSNFELEQEPEPQSQELIATQPHFEVISTKIETTEDVSTFEHRIQPQQCKNPFVLLERLSSQKIQNFTDDENASYQESDEDRRNIHDFGYAYHSAPKVDSVTHELTCKLCHKNFGTDAQLRIHAQICLLYSNNKANLTYCAKCNNFFANTQQLQDHIEFFHRNTISIDSKKPVKPPGTVSFREKSGKQSSFIPNSSFNSEQNPPRKAFFKSLDRLQEESFDNDNHYTTVAEPDPLLLHTNVKVLSTQILMHNPQKKVRLQCSHCRKWYKSKSALNAHIKSVHLKNEIFQCDSCTKSFTRKCSWTEHCKTHTQIKTYQCSVEGCGKLFLSSSALSHHAYVHGKALPFDCRGCKAKFRTSYELKKHVNSVKGCRGTRKNNRVNLGNCEIEKVKIDSSNHTETAVNSVNRSWSSSESTAVST